MMIRRETDYAIRCVLYLAERCDGVVMVNEISGAMKIPRSFLAKILQKLTKARIVKSYRGVKGGFRLRKRPADVSLLDVIEAIEGPLAMNKCVIDRRACSMTGSCTVHPVWVEICRSVEKRLKSHTFADLLSLRK